MTTACDEEVSCVEGAAEGRINFGGGGGGRGKGNDNDKLGGGEGPGQRGWGEILCSIYICSNMLISSVTQRREGSGSFQFLASMKRDDIAASWVREGCRLSCDTSMSCFEGAKLALAAAPCGVPKHRIPNKFYLVLLVLLPRRDVAPFKNPATDSHGEPPFI